MEDTIMKDAIGVLKTKHDLIAQDTNGLCDSIEFHKKAIETAKETIPVLEGRMVALKKAIAVLEKEG